MSDNDDNSSSSDKSSDEEADNQQINQQSIPQAYLVAPPQQCTNQSFHQTDKNDQQNTT